MEKSSRHDTLFCTSTRMNMDFVRVFAIILFGRIDQDISAPASHGAQCDTCPYSYRIKMLTAVSYREKVIVLGKADITRHALNKSWRYWEPDPQSWPLLPGIRP